jgi:hypothetical protein
MLKNISTFFALSLVVVIVIFILLFSNNKASNDDEKQLRDCVDLLNNKNNIGSIKKMQIIGIKDVNNPWVLHYVNCSKDEAINACYLFMASKKMLPKNEVNFKDNKRVYRLNIVQYDERACVLSLYITGRNKGVIYTENDSVYQCDNLVFAIDSIFKKNEKYLYEESQ